MPCIIYMHGNSSCRLEALELIPNLLQANITLFCFDFVGCGNSEGEFISLGWHERDDVNVIVNYLREHRKVSTIGLWGRSMGAATALLHANRDPSIAGMVLDSPFSDLRQLVQELARTHTKVPSFLVSTAMKLIRGSVKDRANFDIYNLTPIQNLGECFIPALFAHGEQDTFI
jgi:pimeloyl-ACP methyl ester carboxylesterase